VFLSIAGRTPGRDPYDQEIARVDIDTGELTVLSAGDEDHQVFVSGRGVTSATETLDLAAGVDVAGFSGLSPSGEYFVEKLTTAAGPARTELRDRNGQLVGLVEAADASRAPPWWRWPEPIRVKAADGVTDLDALVFRPSDLDPGKFYPVIDVVYGGPQEAVVPRGFGGDFFRDGSFFLEPASLAELGFVTIVVDGRGSAARSRTFRAWSYGRLELASDPADHVAAIRQLAAKYAYVDDSRVGITGFSGGGFLAAAAMLRYPDFFKVGVAADGNHDQRLLPHSWGERYAGYPAGDDLRNQANSARAACLKGKLLLIHGLLDAGVNPACTFQFAQALIEANRTFDVLILPRSPHQLSGYGTRRTWDYFVEHLASTAPPADFELTSYLDYREAWLAEMSAPEAENP
jgi:dipeptidyl aminopeptidase/acylaminoacyl peptidase